MTGIIPVILSGGAGTRLWPSSRALYPKQFLALDGDVTMLQQTARRVDPLQEGATECIVVCNEAHRFIVAEQLRTIGKQPRVVLEPAARGTAPAIALAALLAAEEDPDAQLLVMPADHVIADVAALQRAVTQGQDVARDGGLVTFGVVPTHAETGFGYLRARTNAEPVLTIESFEEKPDLETARKYVSGGQHFWNSGIFLFKAESILAALREFSPEIHRVCEKSIANRTVDGFIRPDKETFLRCPNDSIDYAVMEKSDAVAMVPLNAGWSDVGSWSAVHESRQRDACGNSFRGDVLSRTCSNTFVQAESRLVVAAGLSNIFVVETKDSVLVATRGSLPGIKPLVEMLKADDRYEAEHHLQVFRPWGSYERLDEAAGFQVKRLTVNPGSDLSLQKHAFRAEHWVVVQGKVRVTRNDTEFDLAVNESTYIAIGDVHRISNPYNEPAQIIEVQCGAYLGEDDIVRLDDTYGRAGRCD